MLIAARLPRPYLIPGLITRRACAADKRDLGFRLGLLERLGGCSVSRGGGGRGQQGGVGGAEPPFLGVKGPPKARCGVGGTEQPLGEGRLRLSLDGAGIGAENGLESLAPSLLLFKQKELKKTKSFLGQLGDCGFKTPQEGLPISPLLPPDLSLCWQEPQNVLEVLCSVRRDFRMAGR